MKTLGSEYGGKRKKRERERKESEDEKFMFSHPKIFLPLPSSLLPLS